MVAHYRQYRQGDILLMIEDGIPDHVVPVAADGDRVVLAYGEATGHKHALIGRQVELFSEPGDEDGVLGERFLRIVGAAGMLVHEEHDPITVPPGTYRVIRQREYQGEDREDDGDDLVGLVFD
jgi:hypothetical protein